MNVYISSCHEEGGIFRYVLDGDKLIFKEKYDVSLPKYTVSRGGKLYVIKQTAYHDCALSGLLSFDIMPDGSLANESAVVPSGGVGSCHLDVCESGIYVANYYSGSISRITGFGTADMKIETRTHFGASSDMFRQRHAYCHCIGALYDGNIAVCDLGLDKVVLYDASLNRLCDCDLPKGSGPRHFVKSVDGKTLWVLGEMGSTLTRVDYENGMLFARGTLEIYPDRMRELHATTSAAVRISPNGRYVYTSNRGFDVISVIDVSGESARVVGEVSSRGGSPRDFNITPDGKYLIAANEKTGVALFDLAHPIPRPIYAEALERPLCVEFSQTKI